MGPAYRLKNALKNCKLFINTLNVLKYLNNWHDSVSNPETDPAYRLKKRLKKLQAYINTVNLNKHLNILCKKTRFYFYDLFQPFFQKSFIIGPDYD